MNSLKGKNVVVTGSSKGIGKAIALEYAANGANLVINSRNPEESQLVVDEIKANGGSAIKCCGSVAEEAFCEELVEACVSEYGSIDVLVCNAGNDDATPITEVTAEIFRNIAVTHLEGTVNLMRFALKHMLPQKYGRIITAGSGTCMGYLGGLSYPTSKMGLIGLTKCAARDLWGTGVTVNIYLPQAKTPMAQKDHIVSETEQMQHAQYFQMLMDKGYLEKYEVNHILDMPAPEYIAPMIAFLGSEEAGSISGQVFDLTGGVIALFPQWEETVLAYKDHTKEEKWTVEELMALMPGIMDQYNWLQYPARFKPWFPFFKN